MLRTVLPLLYTLSLLGCGSAPPARPPADSLQPSSPIPEAPPEVQPHPDARQRPSELLASEDPEDLFKAERHYAGMGTEILIEAYGDQQALLERALDAAVAELERIEVKMTSWNDTSELSSINLAAGDAPVVVSEELYALIERALYMSELTNSCFDISYAGAGKLWDYKAAQPKLPDEAAVAAALERIGWQKLVLDAEARSVFLPQEGMRIDLGGIAKGYGVERAMEVLVEHGIKIAMVNAGGDLKVRGKKAGQTWRIGIRDPRHKEHMFAIIPVANTSVVTSGDYERFFEVDGVRYHHIIDPRSGKPSQGVTSVTVIARSAEFADALATGIFVMGAEAGLALVERIREAEAVIVDDQLDVHLSSGLQTAKEK